MKGWKTLCFSLVIAVGGVFQAFDWASVIPQDKTWSGLAMIAVGAIIAALRAVTSTPVGKALPDRQLTGRVVSWLMIGLGTLFALLVAHSAFAADLKIPASVALKAPAPPAPPPCTVASCTGFYAGMDISGNGTNVNLLNGIGGSLNANGTEIGGHVGFRTWNGTVYLGAEAGCAYDIGMNISELTPASKVRCLELAKAGGSLTALFSQQQSFQFPQALQNSFMSFYGILGASERYSATGLAAGVGAEFLVAPQVSLTLDYINVSYGGGGASQVGGLVSIPTENLFRLGINYNF